MTWAALKCESFVFDTPDEYGDVLKMAAKRYLPPDPSPEGVTLLLAHGAGFRECSSREAIFPSDPGQTRNTGSLFWNGSAHSSLARTRHVEFARRGPLTGRVMGILLC